MEHHRWWQRQSTTENKWCAKENRFMLNCHLTFIYTFITATKKLRSIFFFFHQFFFSMKWKASRVIIERNKKEFNQIWHSILSCLAMSLWHSHFLNYHQKKPTLSVTSMLHAPMIKQQNWHRQFHFVILFYFAIIEFENFKI